MSSKHLILRSFAGLAIAVASTACVDLDATEEDVVTSSRLPASPNTVSGLDGSDAYAVCLADQKGTYNQCLAVFSGCQGDQEYCSDEFNYNVRVNCVLAPGTAVEPLASPAPRC